MNPANFSNVGSGGTLGGPNPHGQMQNQVFKHVGQALHSQGPFTGWRAEVTTQERGMKVMQMISSLRLIRPQVEIPDAIRVALTFEEKAFREANQKEDYEKECNSKLSTLKDTRARQQAAVMQSGMMQQVGAGGAMPGVRSNQVQAPFAPQMNRPMQTSSMPGQPPMAMAMGMNDPNQQATMQQPQQRQLQPPMPQHQQPQHRPGGVPAGDDMSILTPQENENVSRLAQQMLARTTSEDIERLKMNLTRTMTAEIKQMLAQKNQDPLAWFFRQQALKTWKLNRRRMEMARAQGLDPNNPMMNGDTMMNPAPRQIVPNMMGLQRNSALPMNGQQGLDASSFMGNVENIQGQQADGLRSQEAGQLVVPASNPQVSQQQFANAHGKFQGGAQQQLGHNGQPNANRPGMNQQQFLVQQHLQNAQSVQQERIQQAAQFQAQSQASQAQARAQAAHNAKMTMSTQSGGQAGSQVSQQFPQQSPAMPMLNRPMGPQMSPAQAAAQARPLSRPPGMAGQQPGGQSTRPQIPSNLPTAVQERLAQMTPEQINAFLVTHQRRSMATNQNMAARANGQQSMPMQPNMSQPGQNGQVGSALQQSLSGMGSAQQHNPLIQGQPMSLQQRQNQQRHIQQNEFIKQQMIRSQGGAIDMSTEQMHEMDRVPFPPSMLNTNANMNPPVPKTVKTWGQLKQWVAQNPQVLGNVDLPKLLHLQRLHLAQTMAQPNRNADQIGQMNWNGASQPFMSPQNFQPGQQQPQAPPVNMLKPITANDIAHARQRLGLQAQSFSDDQLRELIHRNRQRHMAQAQQAHNRAASQSSAVQTLNQIQPPQQVAQPQQPFAPQTTTQRKQPPTQPQPPQPNQQPQTTQAAGAKPQPQGTPIVTGKNSKAAVTKATAKKRPHSDDVVEVQNPKAQPSSQVATAQPSTTTAAPARLPLSLTREQLAAIPPQQRAQLEAQMRRQHRPQVTKAAAEEAWNRLPDKLKQLYTDLVNGAPVPEPPSISSEEKATMSQQLRGCTDMLGRMDSLVGWLAKFPGQEKNIRALFSTRMQLMRQFKGPDWTLNEPFTIAPDILSKSIALIRTMFTSMIDRVQNQQQAQRSGAAATQPPGGQSNIPPLNASNLQQLQKQQEAIQRARRTQNQNIPQAPTAAQPPFPLGAPSPQGVPQAYGPGGFSPEKLKIPPSKRRKQSHAGMMPSTTPTAAAPSVISQLKAEASKPPAAEAKAFKCSVPECEYHQRGFPTQEGLNKHTEESHQEHIDDPLQYALDSFSTGLVAHETAKEKTEAKITKKPPAVPKSATVPSVKQEVKAETATPATATGIPIGRVSSQVGLKPASPSPIQLSTPRVTAGKVPGSSNLRPTPSREDKKDAGKVIDSASATEDVVMKDSWANSALSLDLIGETFDAARNESYHGLGGDPFDEFLNSDMFTLAQAEDTPDSIDSGGVVTQTPEDGELSKEDMTIKIGGMEDDNWLPADWFSHPGPLGDRTVIEDPWVEIDWEALERKEADPISGDDGGLVFFSS